MNVYTKAVLSYIRTYVDNLTVGKRIRVFFNQKPWMTKRVRCLLREWNSTFRNGDRIKYSEARANIKRGIKRAKSDYKSKIEEYFKGNNPREGWKGLQHILNHREGTSTDAKPSVQLAKELNIFFARFEVTDSQETYSSELGLNDIIPLVQEHDV